MVRRLSGLLRVADGLDRGHTAAVAERRHHARTRDALVLRVAPRLAGADLDLERWGAARKADVLAKLLKRRVEIVPLAAATAGAPRSSAPKDPATRPSPP